jgi:hypothetical protein
VPLDLLPFLVASVLVRVVPGADMALVTRQVLVGGTGPAQRAIFGNLSGLVVPQCRRSASTAWTRFFREVDSRTRLARWRSSARRSLVAWVRPGLRQQVGP